MSTPLSLIVNQANASKWHKEHCQDGDCGVSLLLLKRVAEELIHLCSNSEKEEAQSTVDGMST